MPTKCPDPKFSDFHIVPFKPPTNAQQRKRAFEHFDRLLKDKRITAKVANELMAHYDAGHDVREVFDEDGGLRIEVRAFYTYPISSRKG